MVLLKIIQLRTNPLIPERVLLLQAPWHDLHKLTRCRRKNLEV
jgi:hypothetical protein